MRRILYLAVIIPILAVGAAQSGAFTPGERGPEVCLACTGADVCRACKNCSSCKHCAKNKGTCGVCK